MRSRLPSVEETVERTLHDVDEDDFEGTLVLERLAEIGQVENFFDAIDRDDVERAAKLMRRAKIDRPTIDLVVQKIEAAGGEH